MKAPDQKKLIDVERVIQSKSPGLYRILPRFILNWLKKKLHEEQINHGLSVCGHLKGHAFNEAAIEYLGINVVWEGEEHIPKTGGVIIASNHPLGGLDGLAFIRAVSSVRKDIRFLVNDILKNFSGYGELFVGVNKVGSTPADALKAIEDVYASEHAVLVFPAGLVSRKQGGKIKDLEWKKSFVSKAIKYNKAIVPVFIDGANSNFFYNFALWRKRLGIKANIEMFFLADEMFRQKNKTIKVIIGKPFYPETLDKSKSQQEWAQEIKECVYRL